MNLGPSDCPCLPYPLCIVWWKHGCLCVVFCVCHNHPTFGHTPWLECVHASVHEFMSTWLPMSSPPSMHSLMESRVALCGQCVCPSLPTSGHTSWLECVHASVHEFMSNWLSMSAPSPMHSLMESWVPLHVSVFVSQSPHFCSNTLFRMCTCISACIYVHMPPLC